MPAIRPERQRFAPAHGCYGQRPVEVRKLGAAPACLPTQVGPQRRRIDGDKHQVRLPGPVLGGARYHLIGTGKMNETIRLVLRRPGVGTRRARRFPLHAPANVIDRLVAHAPPHIRGRRELIPGLADIGPFDWPSQLDMCHHPPPYLPPSRGEELFIAAHILLPPPRWGRAGVGVAYELSPPCTMQRTGRWPCTLRGSGTGFPGKRLVSGRPMLARGLQLPTPRDHGERGGSTWGNEIVRETAAGT